MNALEIAQTEEVLLKHLRSNVQYLKIEDDFFLFQVENSTVRVPTEKYLLVQYKREVSPQEKSLFVAKWNIQAFPVRSTVGKLLLPDFECLLETIQELEKESIVQRAFLNVHHELHFDN